MRRSRSIESPRRHRNGSNNGGGGGGRRDYRRYSRSRSRSRERSREQNFRRRTSRSRSRERVQSSHYRRGASAEKDLYRDIINDDYQDDKNYAARGGGGGAGGSDNRHNRDNRGRDDDYNEERDRFWNDRARDDYQRGRDYRDRDYERERGDRKDYHHNRHGGRRYNSADRDSGDDSDESYNSHNLIYNKTPSNTIIVLGLKQHITEADITGALIQQGMAATSIRLIRKRTTGASRGFAFVEFNTIDEAARWMELTQVSLVAHQIPHNLTHNTHEYFICHCHKLALFNCLLTDAERALFRRMQKRKKKKKEL